MIEFYKAGTTEFEGGEILNEAYEAKIIHERNGRFDLEFKIPIQEVKFEMHDIFLAHVPYMGKQGFYLTDIKKKLNHIIIYAKHLFFMIDKNVTNDLHTLTNGDTGQLVMDKFQSSLQIPTQFNFTSDITDRHIFNKPSYNNALEVLTEGKHSILGQWEGVLVMDNFDIKLKKRWGRDTEYLIAKRKNISDLEIRDIGDNITTRLFLKKELEDKSIITAVIDSPLIDEYPQVYGEVRETSDQSIESVEDLIIHGENIFRTQRIDLPTESFEFEVTEDVKDYEFTIDDTALIYYSDYDIYKRVLISSYEYDPIEKKYLKINFGERPKSMSQQVAEKVDKEYIKPTINSLDEIIAGIIEGLDDPTGGVIQFTEDAEGNIIEMLILDNENRELAKDVWRFNIQGLSHSSNGINGDFDIAMTQDGKFVADFIATGTLNAALIKAGILHSLEGNTWIDMETGHFKLGGIEYNESGFSIKLSSGESVEDAINKSSIIKSDEEPENPDLNTIWLQGDVLYKWNGEEWEDIGKSSQPIFDAIEENELMIKQFDDRIEQTISKDVFEEYRDGTTARIEEVEQSFTQTAEEWDLRFSRTTGFNKLKNSVGFSTTVIPETLYEDERIEIDYWETSGTATTIQSSDLEALGSGSAFILEGTMEQIVPVQAGEKYTVSLKVKNEEVGTNANLNLTVVDIFGEYDQVINDSEWTSVSEDEDFIDVKLTFTAEANRILINLDSNSVPVMITNIMLNDGEYAHTWTPYPKELYTTNFKSDERGFRVIQLESGREVGYTEMTPFEFAGYYDGEKVFKMNKEIFEMTNAKVEKEIQIGNHRFVAMSNGIGIVPTIDE